MSALRTIAGWMKHLAACSQKPPKKLTTEALTCYIKTKEMANDSISQTANKALYTNFVGKTGFARAAHTLWFYAVSRFEELHKTGKLAENCRFFDKLKR